MNLGMLIGFAGLILGLPLLLIGIRLVYIGAPNSPRRARGFVLGGVGFAMIWIGGFIGAFASLGGS